MAAKSSYSGRSGAWMQDAKLSTSGISSSFLIWDYPAYSLPAVKSRKLPSTSKKLSSIINTLEIWANSCVTFPLSLWHLELLHLSNIATFYSKASFNALPSDLWLAYTYMPNRCDSSTHSCPFEQTKVFFKVGARPLLMKLSPSSSSTS